MGFYSGVLRMALKIRPLAGFRILMYHHVSDDEDIFLPGITTPVFSRQMEYLHREYSVLDLNDLMGMLDRGETIPPRAAALTFDDGYEDVYRNAFPVLKQYNLPATVFISTGFIDGDNLPWTDELGFLFKRTEKTGLDIENGEQKESFQWADEEGKFIAFKRLKGMMKILFEAEREIIFQQVKRQLSVFSPNPIRIMNSSIVREMSAAGVSFGSHTVHHPILSRVPPRRAQEEIRESKHRLEAIIGQEVRGFCYPNGGEDDFNEVIKGMVQHAGYQYACTTIDGINGQYADRYELKRLWTSEDSLSLFAARLIKQSDNSSER